MAPLNRVIQPPLIRFSHPIQQKKKSNFGALHFQPNKHSKKKKKKINNKKNEMTGRKRKWGQGEEKTHRQGPGVVGNGWNEGRRRRWQLPCGRRGRRRGKGRGMLGRGRREMDPTQLISV